jgi:hypothetical protein
MLAGQEMILVGANRLQSASRRRRITGALA